MEDPVDPGGAQYGEGATRRSGRAARAPDDRIVGRVRKMRRLTIMFYLHSWLPHVSGITMRYKAIFDHLVANGYGIILLTPYADSPEYHGITTVRIDGTRLFFMDDTTTHQTNRIADPVFYAQTLRTCVDLCRTHRVDVIHCTYPDTMQAVCWTASRLLRIPLVSVVHTDGHAYLRAHRIPSVSRELALWLDRIAVALFPPDLLMYTSETFRRQDLATVHRSPALRTDVLPMYIDHGTFRPTHPSHVCAWSRDSLRLLYVGRVEAEKSIEDILHAMTPITMSLVVVGEGAERARLAQLARAMGVDVRFVGTVAHDQLAGWYSSADIFVQPSSTETLGFTTVEALACGTCVVARKAGGNTEVIAHEQTGILYHDVPHLRHLLQTTGATKRQRLASSGRKSVEHRTVDASVGYLRRQYQSLGPRRSVALAGVAPSDVLGGLAGLAFSFLRAVAM